MISKNCSATVGQVGNVRVNMTSKVMMILLEKLLGVNEKLLPKSGPNGSMWVRPSSSIFCIY
jgi:hypothetical protein